MAYRGIFGASSGALDLTSTLPFAGLYEQQDDNQVEHNLRGVFKTDAEGKYSFYCLRPTPYPVSVPPDPRRPRCRARYKSSSKLTHTSSHARSRRTARPASCST